VLRELGTFASIRVNNFFLFVALLIYGSVISGMPPKAAEPFIVLLCLLLLFPMSSDPLALIPRERLASWPLARWQRLALRLASLALSPVFWVAVIILLKTASVITTLAFLAIAVAAQLIVVLSPRANLLRLIPRFPGRLGGVVRLSVRQMLSVLDVYLALLLSASGTAYRLLSRHPDPAAFPIMAFLVALALSTYVQSLFGLDLAAGVTRYRLLPLRGWEILLAKDAAYLAILLVLVLPLSPLAGLTFGVAALAIGHHPSVFAHLPQHRWRFTDGRVVVGVIQVVVGVTLGFAAQQRGVLVLLLTLLVWCASLAWYGRCWERSTGT
jgi:hypothetical protein